MIATIVCVHAHPDGEALLTGGTIARLSAEGHRVVLVVATDGSLGLPESVSQHLSRLDELKASAGSGRARWMESGAPEGGPPAGVVGGRRAAWLPGHQERHPHHPVTYGGSLGFTCESTLWFKACQWPGIAISLFRWPAGLLARLKRSH